LSRFPVTFRRTGVRFLGILSPPGNSAFVTSGLPAAPDGAPDPDGIPTFRMPEQRPGWAPPQPRGQRCSHDRRGLSGRRLPFLNGQALHPGLHPILRGSCVTRHQQGFTHVRPSGLPLACIPGWNGSASASFLSSAPRSYPQRTSGRGLALNTSQELCHRRHRRSSNRQAHSKHATSCRTTSPQMLTRYGASARGARARRSYDRIMDDSP